MFREGRKYRKEGPKSIEAVLLPNAILLLLCLVETLKSLQLEMEMLLEPYSLINLHAVAEPESNNLRK